MKTIPSPHPLPHPRPAAEVLQKYDVSRTTFWRWRGDGLRCFKVGGKLYLKESDVVAFIERMGAVDKRLAANKPSNDNSTPLVTSSPSTAVAQTS